MKSWTMSTKQSAAAGLIDLVVALSPRSRVADGALSLIPRFSSEDRRSNVPVDRTLAVSSAHPAWTRPSLYKETVMAEEMTKVTSGTLIAAGKVEGTHIYNLQGEKLGTVDDIMIDKVSGKAIYAIMSFGGFLGIGEKYHPLPWSTLKYDERQGGYVVNLDKEMLENAPTYGVNEGFPGRPTSR